MIRNPHIRSTANGNITAATGDSRTVNDQNQLTQIDSNTITYDAAGNLTTDDQGHTLVCPVGEFGINVAGSLSFSTTDGKGTTWKVVLKCDEMERGYVYMALAIEEKIYATVTQVDAIIYDNSNAVNRITTSERKSAHRKYPTR